MVGLLPLKVKAEWSEELFDGAFGLLCRFVIKCSELLLEVCSGV